MLFTFSRTHVSGFPYDDDLAYFILDMLSRHTYVCPDGTMTGPIERGRHEDNPWGGSRGNHVYNLAVLLPNEISSKILVKPSAVHARPIPEDTFLTGTKPTLDGYYPLSAMIRRCVCEGIRVDEETLRILPEYSVILHGPLHPKPPLEIYHIGTKVMELLEASELPEHRQLLGRLSELQERQERNSELSETAAIESEPK